MIMTCKSKYFLFLSFALTALMCSCATEDLGEKANGKSPIQIKYKVNELISESRSVTNPPMKNHVMNSDKGQEIFLKYTSVAGITPQTSLTSRGKAVTFDDFFDDYGLFGYHYSSGISWASYSSSVPAPAPFIENESVAKVKNWMTNEFYEGSSYRYSFFGYAPHNAAGVSATPSSTNLIKPGFHYSVPELALEESDLLVGKDLNVPGSYNNIRYMPFTHALTAVRFALGAQMAPCTITHLRIVGAYGEADYDYDTDSWLNISTPKNFMLEQSYEIKDGESNRILNNEDNIFMMLPQTVPSSASVEITVYDGETHVFKTGIGGDIWQRGHMITYYISTSQTTGGNMISISASSEPVSGLGGTIEYTVNSYYQTYYGTQTPVPWTGVYSVDDETTTHTTPEGVVTAFTASGDGEPTGEVCDLTLLKTTPVSTINSSVHTAALRSAPDGSKDLASGKGSANCYVINAPGTYTFPIVYGNSVKADGSTNSAAFTSSATDPVFVNNTGAQITSPNISGAVDAVIVWQDAPHLIAPSTLKLNSTNTKVEFEVKRDSICQGNAVIAVRDASENILWSWHIWVTDEDLTQVKHLVNTQTSTSACDVMPVPLGYCNYEKRPYETRKVKITVTQPVSGGQTATAIINQGGIEEEYFDYGGNAPYYQWGRKDPFLPSTGKANANKPVFDNAYNMALGNENYSDISSSILNPHRMSSAINGSNELWNAGGVAGLSDDPIVKTVYDPCPVGFSVPRSSCYVGLGDSGRSYNGKQDRQVGKFIYSNGPASGYGVFFPSLGHKTSQVNLGDVNNQGDYWPAGSYNSGNAYYFSIYYNGSIGYPNITRTYGFNIMPEVY